MMRESKRSTSAAAISQLLKSRIITGQMRRSAEFLRTQIETELAKEMARAKVTDGGC